MTPQQKAHKIAELEQTLKDNPNHPDRITIEADLRHLKEESRPFERDTFDLREHQFYNV